MLVPIVQSITGQLQKMCIRDRISPQRFEQLAAWRLEKLGKVTGLVEIDFDKGLLSALNIMDGIELAVHTV